MKLKLIAYSMGLLGLISCPAFAQTQNNPTLKPTQGENTKNEGQVIYKEGALPSTACPVASLYTLYMDQMGQNTGRAKPTAQCNNPLQLAGGMNFDSLWGNRHQGYQGETNNRFALNDAYINFTGKVNEWARAFIEISYSNLDDRPLTKTASGPYPLNKVSTPKPGIYSKAYNSEKLDLQQGVIILGNPSSDMPVFLRIGKQFLDFGRYQLHPMTRSMTQTLTETLQTAVEASFITAWGGVGLHGSLFAFENPMAEGDTSSSLGKTNYGGQMGFGTMNGPMKWDAGLGYLYNFTGVNDVAYAVTLTNSGAINGEGSYDNRVSAGTLYGMVITGPFSLAAHYVTALQHFDSDDLTAPDGHHNSSAKPWAADVQAGYMFTAFDRNQNAYIGYQVSDEAVNLYLPKSRWLAGYTVDVANNTNVGFELAHDQDYDKKDAGSGEGSFRGILRVGVKFG